jgi:hypothetical protein
VTKNYTIKQVNGITIIAFSQPPTFDEAKEVIDKLANDNSYHLRLWDFSNAVFNFTMDEIKSIAVYGKSKFLEKNRLALVAPQDLAYGLLRAFEVYREQDAHFSVPRVFRNRQEAMEWLEEQKKVLDFSPYT